MASVNLGGAVVTAYPHGQQLWLVAPTVPSHLLMIFFKKYYQNFTIHLSHVRHDTSRLESTPQN